MRVFSMTAALTGLLLLSACAAVPTAPSPEAKAALAPTGKLRVGLYLGNPLSAVRDPATQEIKGMGYELGRELARRLNVPFEPVVHDSVGAVIAGTKANRWDIAVLVISSDRAHEVDFTTPVVELELGYLVPGGSSLMKAADVDRAGLRIAVPAKGQGDVVLTSLIKQATLIRTPGLAALTEAVKSGKADAAAANKPILFELSRQLPGSRILEGRFSAEQVGFAIPKGRDAGVAYARKFVEDAKAEGLVKAALEKSGARGALVAPPQAR